MSTRISAGLSFFVMIIFYSSCPTAFVQNIRLIDFSYRQSEFLISNAAFSHLHRVKTCRCDYPDEYPIHSFEDPVAAREEISQQYARQFHRQTPNHIRELFQQHIETCRMLLALCAPGTILLFHTRLFRHHLLIFFWWHCSRSHTFWLCLLRNHPR